MNRLQLEELAKLIHSRNELEEKITGIIERPALIGHIGEYIAQEVFAIKLNESASHKGTDGNFKTGSPLAGGSVNIKWYRKQEGLLDLIVETDKGPDYYLVLAGPKGDAKSSRGTTRPSLINFAYLFDAKELIPELKRNGVNIGIATSVRKYLWDKAMIYPNQHNTILQLSKDQESMLQEFGVRHT